MQRMKLKIQRLNPPKQGFKNRYSANLVVLRLYRALWISFKKTVRSSLV
jgi:hypothetical protein